MAERDDKTILDPLTAAAHDDPDNPPIADDATWVSGRDVPEKVARLKAKAARMRGAINPVVMLDLDVAEHFGPEGPDFRDRINEALREVMVRKAS